jgi:hypothetical protein
LHSCSPWRGIHGGQSTISEGINTYFLSRLLRLFPEFDLSIIARLIMIGFLLRRPHRIRQRTKIVPIVGTSSWLSNLSSSLMLLGLSFPLFRLNLPIPWQTLQVGFFCFFFGFSLVIVISWELFPVPSCTSNRRWCCCCCCPNFLRACAILAFWRVAKTLFYTFQ